MTMRYAVTFQPYTCLRPLAEQDEQTPQSESRETLIVDAPNQYRAADVAWGKLAAKFGPYVKSEYWHYSTTGPKGDN